MQRGLAPIIVVLLVVAALAAVGGAYYFGQSSSQKQPTVINPTPDATAIATTSANIDNTANWEVYSESELSFNYPSTWRRIDQIPEQYKKILHRKCSGPMLQNTETPSTLIVMEKLSSGGGDYCWSREDFSNTYTRKTNDLANKSEIEVIKWQENDNNQTPKPTWEGDLFQSYEIGTYTIALIYQNGQDESAEATFDKIISTFKVTQ